MTHRDPDEWYLPSRIPQHAAPFGFAPPFHRARLLLRLVVTAGIWAVGLCIIIGLVLLVSDAAADDRPAGTGVLQHPKQQSLNRNQISNPVNVPRVAMPGMHSLPYSLKGHGPATSAKFIVSGGARWMIRWSYRCQADASSGQFAVQDVMLAGGESTAAPAIDGPGVSGHGTVTLDRGSRMHYLVISSACAWSIAITR